MNVDAVASAFVNDELHLVFVSFSRFVAFNLCQEIRGGNTGLIHRHVSYFRAAEVYAVAYGVHALDSLYFQSRIYFYETVRVCNAKIRSGTRAPEKVEST